jgi:peptide chain release factor 3
MSGNQAGRAAPDLAPDALLVREVSKRRTFAIISHPDAGKTTLTEKFLLYAGWLRSAGTVRGRKGGAAATSDWMSMERERGISITSSVLRISYGERLLTILDTPGHVDFSDDTYRTLTAADCAVLVVDASKGVEEQTRKLCEVCRLQRIPVLVFVNKMDLEGRAPLELISEIERELDLHVVAFDWPAGQGREFRGVVDRGLLGGGARVLHACTRAGQHGAQRANVRELPFPSPEAAQELGPEASAQLDEELELLDEAGNEFSEEAFLTGRCSPIFFGSALTNFGLEPFFDAFGQLAPAPRPRSVNLPDGGSELVDPIETPFSGYIYKIQANMDPRHRDSLAFLRICSGRLSRDLTVAHCREQQVLKRLKISRVYTLAARERETIDDAWPGDVVAIPNAGFAIGDTLSMRGGFWYGRLPQFTPAIFATVELLDFDRRKQYDRAMELLAVEGAVLVLQPVQAQRRPVVAALGRLQFEVLQHRMQEEYGVKVGITILPYSCSTWVEGDPATFNAGPQTLLTREPSGRLLALFASEWDRDFVRRSHREHRFRDHW